MGKRNEKIFHSREHTVLLVTSKCKSRLGFLAAQRLRFYASNAGNTSSIPGQGTGELGSHMPCGTAPKTKSRP